MAHVWKRLVAIITPKQATQPMQRPGSPRQPHHTASYKPSLHSEFQSDRNSSKHLETSVRLILLKEMDLGYWEEEDLKSTVVSRYLQRLVPGPQTLQRPNSRDAQVLYIK